MNYMKSILTFVMTVILSGIASAEGIAKAASSDNQVMVDEWGVYNVGYVVRSKGPIIWFDTAYAYDYEDEGFTIRMTEDGQCEKVMRYRKFLQSKSKMYHVATSAADSSLCKVYARAALVRAEVGTCTVRTKSWDRFKMEGKSIGNTLGQDCTCTQYELEQTYGLFGKAKQTLRTLDMNSCLELAASQKEAKAIQKAFQMIP